MYVLYTYAGERQEGPARRWDRPNNSHSYSCAGPLLKESPLSHTRRAHTMLIIKTPLIMADRSLALLILVVASSTLFWMLRCIWDIYITHARVSMNYHSFQRALALRPTYYYFEHITSHTPIQCLLYMCYISLCA